MHGTGYVYEREVESQDRDDPSVDTCARYDIGIVEHSFDVLCVNFDNEVSDSYDVQSEFSECAVEAVDLKFRLREASFAVVECDRSKSIVVVFPSILGIALTEIESNSDIGGVDSEDNGRVGGIIDWSECGRIHDSLLEVILSVLLFRSPFERCSFSG